MSDPVTNVEIEDVLASIRRLVSVEERVPDTRLTPVDDALVLTPAQMVAEPAAPEAPRDAEAEAPDNAPFPLTVEHHAEPVDDVAQDVSHKEDDISEIDPEEAAIRARVAELEAVIAAQQDSSDWEPEDGAEDMSPEASVEVLHWEDHVAEADAEARERADDVVLEAEPDMDDEEPEDWAPEPEHGPAKVVMLEDVVADAVMQELARGEGDAADGSDPAAAYDEPFAAFEEAARDETYAAPETETHEAYGTDDWSDHAASAHAEEDYLTEGEPHGWDDASHDDGQYEAHAPVAGPQAEVAYEDDTYEDEADHVVGADAELSSAAREEATPDYAAPDDLLLDEETLREMVTDIVRQELQGALGERITRNVRKLVRREIHRALTAQELE